MRKATRAQWVKFAIVTVLYLAFLIWVKSWLGLIVVPFIFDIYISKKKSLGLLEKIREPGCTQRDELDRRYRVCTGSCLLRQYLCIPELPDTFFFTGEIIVGRRLPLRQQIKLRSTRAQYTIVHAAGSAHPATGKY